ncbi:MAG: sugar kinase, ribokinase family [Candidatus Peribacteria bacterium]|nr:sugar kinase, ribokinase family [Candidatus Peribacteria bacterium]
MSTHTIVGLGELLWDLLPEGKKMGGAPANFAYHCGLLGNNAVVASRIGTDALGDEALQIIADHGLDSGYIQRDAVHPTGSVSIVLDEKKQAQYEFASDVAWDYMECTEQWKILAAKTDAICFGTLAQRNSVSSKAVGEFLSLLPANALKVFDVNLRGTFYSAELLDRLLHSCNLLKLNHQELPVIAQLLSLGTNSEVGFARAILEKYPVETVCTTKGEEGSLFVTHNRVYEHQGYAVEVADTVGAGDAFCAAFVHYYLAGSPLEEIAEEASRRGAWVATQSGAMPSPATYTKPESCIVPALAHA